VLQSKTHDIIRFGIGSPGADAIPAALSTVGAQVVRDSASGVFDYGPTEGDAGLRAAVLGFFRRRHFAIEENELLITSGGMQGLDLVAKLFIGAGDLIVVESPTYTNGSAVVRSYEGELLEVPVDGNGMDVDSLAAQVAESGRTPKAIYTIPNFQNPAGVTLSLDRRRRLLDLAHRWGSLIIEDDPYGDLRFAGESLPSLAELADGRVLVVGVYTFSKVLAPGLRVGWVTAPAEVIAKMIDARQGMDTCTNVPLQRLVAGVVADGTLDEHLVHLRDLYQERRSVMLSALAEIFGDLGAIWTVPDGGFFIWLTLPEGCDMQKLLEPAVDHGVAYIPGTAFTAVPGRFTSAARLCYATTPPARIREGVQRLRDVVVAAYPWLVAPGTAR